MRVLVSIYLNFLIAAVEKVDERRLIKVEMEILGELQAKDMMENQATIKTNEIKVEMEILGDLHAKDRMENQTIIKTNEIVEEPQTELLDQCRDDCRDRNCLITDHHD